MNKVILMGRLTRDPMINHSQGDSNSVVARFTVAVDRRFKRDNGPTADFIGCVAFGRTAEFIEQYIRRGTKIVLTGRIQTGSYNKDGQTVYTTDVVAEEVEFAESKKAAQENGSMGNYVPAGQPSAPSPQNAAPVDGFMNIPEGIDEELPFN